MSDITTLAVQKIAKPKIEDVIPEILMDNVKDTAMDFVAHLRKNKMSPGWAGYHNAWDAKCKGKTICKVRLGAEYKETVHINGNWNVTLYLKNTMKYENTIFEENLQNFIWDNVSFCHSCGTCAPEQKNVIFLGKEMNGVCRHCYNQIRFRSPNASDMDKIKRLLELERQARNL
ncbi:MAG: hypothetical protein FWD16_03905 [Clostridia bacterium]|nr:hypothetical protein [Clostridia bacterium]